MNKSSLWIWSLAIVICLVIVSWFLGFGLGGCSSTQQEIATTTTSAGTTTTTLALTWSGIKHFGTSAIDEGGPLLTDADGNIYLVGGTGGGFDGYTYQGDGFDVFLAKFDSAGNRKWTKQTVTSGDDGPSSAARDSDGNIYIAGTTTGSFEGYTNAGGRDTFLLKYDSNGNKLWVKQFRTDSEENEPRVAVDSSGNVYLAGNTTSGIDENAPIGSEDFFLMKFDPSGNKQWTQQFGTTGWEKVMEVKTDPDGNIYLTGIVLVGGLYGNTNKGLADAFLMKCDPTDGHRLWTEQFGSAAVDQGMDLAIDATGSHIYVGGISNGALPGNSNLGEIDLFLAKYDFSGNQQWIKQFGTSNVDDGVGVVVDSTGAVYLVGSTQPEPGPLKSGNDGLFLIKTDSDGTELWRKIFDRDEVPSCNGSVTDLHDNLFLTGSDRGGFDGYTSVGGADDADVFLVKFDSSGNLQ